MVLGCLLTIVLLVIGVRGCASMLWRTVTPDGSSSLFPNDWKSIGTPAPTRQKPSPALQEPVPTISPSPPPPDVAPPPAQGPIPIQTPVDTSSGETETLSRAQTELPPLLGNWFYPGAQVLRVNTQPRPNVPYSVAILLTRDDVESVIAYYATRVPVLERTPSNFLGRGPRPGDGHDTVVRVQWKDNLTYINFSSG